MEKKLSRSEEINNVAFIRLLFTHLFRSIVCAKRCINYILNMSKAWPCRQGISSPVKHVFPGLIRAMNIGADICVERHGCSQFS